MAGIRRILAVAWAASVMLGLAAPARAGLLGNDFNGNLYDVDTATGAATNPRSTGITNLNGIAFSPGGTLYGLNAFVSSVTPNSLYQIDPTTGASTLIGPTGLNNIFEGDLGFDPTTGILYGIQDVPSNYRLFTISTATGAATIVGNMSPASDLSALAFDSAGNLYILDTGSDQLLTVDKTTAAILGSISLSVDLGPVAGMSFNPADGVLYVADGSGGTNNLYTLDSTSGLLTLVGPTGLSNGLAGLAFSPTVTAVPEPSSFAIAACGVFAAIGYARLRRGRATEAR